METKEWSSQIVNFLTPGTGVLVLGCGYISHIVKMLNFFIIPLLYSQAYIKQTMYDDVERVSLNYRFHDTYGRGSCARS